MAISQSSISSGPSERLQIIRKTYERIAPFYDLLDLPFEYGRYRHIRPSLFRGLSGRLLDAGVGTGRNMAYYPPGAEVLGIDISPEMLWKAERRRRVSDASVELAEMDLTKLTFPDAHFDAAVGSFVLCTLPETLQIAALKELGRVVRQGGVIRLLDYTRPKGSFRRLITRLWEPWVNWAYGAHFHNPVDRLFPEAGLVLVSATFVVDDLIRLVEARPA